MGHGSIFAVQLATFGLMFLAYRRMRKMQTKFDRALRVIQSLGGAWRELATV